MKVCGVGFFGFIGITFLILLVCKIGVFDNSAMEWSWWIITSPFWCIPAIIVGIMLLGICITIICAIIIGICYLVYLLYKWTVGIGDKRRANIMSAKEGKNDKP